jgi:drug/metabolite transporter (DMT)-like permease
MEGIILTLLSAASFGANAIVVRRGLFHMSAGQGLYITVLLGIPLFAVAAMLTGELSQIELLSAVDFLLLAGAGVIHFIIGRYCTFRATDAIGANRTMPIQATSGFYSVIIAVIFLNEKLNVAVGIGIVLVMLGPALIAEGSRRERRALKVSSESVAAATTSDKPMSPEPPPTRLVEGYVFGLLSAVAYGTSPVFIRAALNEFNGLGVLGGLVSYVAAGLVLLVGLVFMRDRPSRVASVVREGAKSGWFVAATVGVFFAQFFRYLALAVAPVSLVVPLTHTRPVFTVMFSFLFNRHVESFSPSTLAGIVLAMAGAVAIGIGSI